MTVSPEKIAEMLAAAEKATPGPWMTAGGANSHVFDLRIVRDLPEEPIVAFSDGADAAHIANCDPQTITAILTELTTLRSQLSGITDETSSWQPIETAPKDGAHFIAWDGFHVFECMWNGQWAQAQTLDGRPWTKFWQPLPTPPLGAHP
jgi:hypothetical protein